MKENVFCFYVKSELELKGVLTVFCVYVWVWKYLKWYPPTPPSVIRVSEKMLFTTMGAIFQLLVYPGEDKVHFN